jgi:hypothetical protein
MLAVCDAKSRAMQQVAQATKEASPHQQRQRARARGTKLLQEYMLILAHERGAHNVAMRAMVQTGLREQNNLPVTSGPLPPSPASANLLLQASEPRLGTLNRWENPGLLSRTVATVATVGIVLIARARKGEGYKEGYIEDAQNIGYGGNCRDSRDSTRQ